MPAPRIVVPAAICALGVLSLLIPFTLFYDPWAWLVWGREVAGLDLNTNAGPSWKPLVVMIDTLLAPAGAAAPDLWLLVARIGWLAAAALAYRLAWRLIFPVRVSTRLAVRFAPRRVRLARNLAGALAAVGVVLLFDPFTSWTRQFAGGLSEPMLVAFVLAAVDRGLSRCHLQALGLGFAAALLRPEAWPLIAAYGVWLWRRSRTPGFAADGGATARRWLIAAAVSLPVLWLVPDLLGSGNPLTGAERAREATGAPAHEFIESLGRSFELVMAALWAGAVVAVVTARRHHERELVLIALGAAAWLGIVAVLAAAGYAGLPRFAAAAGAIVCVLGGVGLVRLLAAIDGMRAADRARHAALALAGLLGVALLIQGAVRVAAIPGDVDRALDYGDRVERLAELTDRVGRDHARSCPPVTTTSFLTETALAWQLHLALDRVDLRLESAPSAGIGFVEVGEGDRAGAAIRAAGEPLATVGAWSAWSLGCGKSDLVGPDYN